MNVRAFKFKKGITNKVSKTLYLMVKTQMSYKCRSKTVIKK